MLGWDRTALITRADDPLPGTFHDAYDGLIARRSLHEPVAYIVGQREFYGRPFTVTPAVLIPRPETELMVDTVLRLLPADTFVRLVDVGTGSGAVALTLAAERPQWHIEATDISSDALRVALRNAEALGVRGQVTFLEGDLLAPTMGVFDAIVSNPPYVPLRDAAGVHPTVRDHEPHVALFGGDDGRALPQRLMIEALPRLTPGGLFVMEFGDGQEADTVANATAAGLQVIEVLDDLQGIARTMVARRP